MYLSNGFNIFNLLDRFDVLDILLYVHTGNAPTVTLINYTGKPEKWSELENRCFVGEIQFQLQRLT